MFAGSGGPKNEEEAPRLVWYAFPHDDDALEEFAELSGSYADSIDDPVIRSGAEKAARKAEDGIKNLKDVEGFIRDQYVRKKADGKVDVV